jgi:RecA/RadA recombinase
MVRKKKELIPQNKFDLLLTRLNENVKEGESKVCKARDISLTWRYVDFVNPTARLPCISLEYLMGARGLLAGRIAQLRATYSKGKSSFMFLMYAAGQILSDAFCYHIETEGAMSPADYIASFGCDVDKLLTDEVASLEKCMDKVDRFILNIRGGRGGTTSEQTGRRVATKFVDPVDAAMASPVLVGIDSLSSLGIDSLVTEDVIDLTSTPAVAQHTRKLREFFRDRAQRFKESQALVMLTSHQTAKIDTGRQHSQDKKSALAQEAIGIHATYVFDISSTPYKDKDVGGTIGDVVTLYTHKNKISPRGRELSLYLVWNKGFDLVKTDVEFLLNHQGSPFTKEECYRHAQGITCKLLSDKPFKSEEEFLRAFYEKQDLVMALREKMRIRGCGFKFETMYMPSEAEIEDNKNSAESDVDGVEGSTGKVSETGDAH